METAQRIFMNTVNTVFIYIYDFAFSEKANFSTSVKNNSLRNMLVESTTSKRGHGGQQGTISLSQILQNRPGGLTDTGQIENC